MPAPSSSIRKSAPVALLVGSLAAPLVYVLSGSLSPEGFHNLRGADMLVLLTAFGSAWLFSAVLTFSIGGASWVPLHAFGYDSLASYLLIATASAIALSLIAGATPEFFGISLAAANAGVIRAIEVEFNRHANRTA